MRKPNKALCSLLLVMVLLFSSFPMALSASDTPTEAETTTDETGTTQDSSGTEDTTSTEKTSQGESGTEQDPTEGSSEEATEDTTATPTDSTEEVSVSAVMPLAISTTNVIDIGMSSYESGVGWTYDNTTHVFTVADDVRVIGQTATNRIVVDSSGGEVEISLAGGVRIEPPYGPAIDIAGDTAKLMLETGSVITLTGSGNYPGGDYSSANPAGVYVPSDAELTIVGEGRLKVTGGSGGTASGAGIGGAYADPDCGTITIMSGTIDATGGSGSAGIGGSYAHAFDGTVYGGSGGSITINDGTIRALSSGSAAGIGGGGGGFFRGGDSGQIIIRGGKIDAESTYIGAGIGSGGNALNSSGGPYYSAGSVGLIQILDGIVNATSAGNNSSAIGAGSAFYPDGSYRVGGGGTIIISGGTTTGNGGLGGNATNVEVSDGDMEFLSASSPAIRGNISISGLYDYTYWTNTIDVNPGGVGTRGFDTPFLNSDTYRYVRFNGDGNDGGGGDDTAPTITGDTQMTLTEGYSATATTAYAVSGTPTITLAKTGDAKIIWNPATMKLEIPAGLTRGTYIATLTATNSYGNDDITFTLTVIPADTPPDPPNPPDPPDPPDEPDDPTEKPTRPRPDNDNDHDDDNDDDYTPPRRPAKKDHFGITNYISDTSIRTAIRNANDDLAKTRAHYDEGHMLIKPTVAMDMFGYEYIHDTHEGTVQVRVRIPEPERLKSTVYLCGAVYGREVDRYADLFRKYYLNDLRVVDLHQNDAWGQTVKLSALVDFGGMDTDNLYFYSYNKETHEYHRIETNYTFDRNGYIHFSSDLGGAIIISDGKLRKEGEAIDDYEAPPKTGGDEVYTPATETSLQYPADNANPSTGAFQPLNSMATPATQLPSLDGGFPSLSDEDRQIYIILLAFFALAVILPIIEIEVSGRKKKKALTALAGQAPPTRPAQQIVRSSVANRTAQHPATRPAQKSTSRSITPTSINKPRR